MAKKVDNSNKLNPVNNKTLFSSLSDVFGQVMRDEMTCEKANTLGHIAGRMQKSLEIEINRYRAVGLIDKTKAKLREIEVIVIDDRQSQLSDEDNNSL